MPIRSVEDAKAEIGHHFEGLAALAREVHRDFLRDCRVIAPFIGGGTRALIYRDTFVRKLRNYCDNTTGAHLHHKSQLTLVGLESRWALRVKRLCVGFSVGVSRTEAAVDYDGNKVPEYASDLFPDAPTATFLYLGWSVPENAPQEIQTYLVCNDSNRKVLWAIALNEGDDGRGIQQPLPIDGDDDQGVGIRIRVKGEERKHG